MISEFYRRHGKLLLALVALSFPFFYFQANSIPCNNDIETWLPRNTEVRQTYERFKHDFGVEEVIVLGFQRKAVDSTLIEAVASRIDQIPGIAACWSADRIQSQMAALGVELPEARQRLAGLLDSPESSMVGVIALLSQEGAGERARLVSEVRRELDYCLIAPEDFALTGPPVIVTELDRLGSPQVGRKFFAITCGVSLFLLYLSFGHWGMSLATLGVTLWGIYVTQSVLYWFGGEMNFIMGSLAVMVMIFTLSIAVHFVSYYTDAKNDGAKDPLSYALLECWKPCWLSTLTTLLGLISLNVSTILPVAQFGYAAALGAILALVVGLGIMPALTVIWPDCQTRSLGFRWDFGAWGDYVAANKRWMLVAGVLATGITSIGLMRLKSDVDPVEFLPRNSTVLTDLQKIESDLTNIDSLEAVVNFGSSGLAFVERLDRVRSIQDRIAKHPGIRHVMSAASFLPAELPESTFETARILNQARSMQDDSGWVVDDQRLWRISARVRRSKQVAPTRVLAELEQELAGEPIHFTGLTPLLRSAQDEIFDGFWQSFAAACVTISIVMILSLRSVLAGVVAMVPNIIPIWLVFGSVGFLGSPVDIGMMMTGSIALGISVDCTFHFLVHYRDAYNSGCTSAEACRRALQHSGEPMLESTLICSLGMLALCLSSFVPTARFGALMAAQMGASILGELVFLPALLCCRPERRTAASSSAEPQTIAGQILESHPQAIETAA